MTEAVTRRISTRKLTILLLLVAPDAEGRDSAPIDGTTRMQKLVFLSMEEAKGFLRESEGFTFDFRFDADRFGPADMDLYQDLEVLKATGWILIDGETGIGSKDPQSVFLERSVGGAPILPEEHDEEEIVRFQYLMGEKGEETDVADTERQMQREYRITEKGIAGLRRISEEPGKAEKFNLLAGVCKEVKRKYGAWPLNLLLKHVYEPPRV